MAGKPAPQNKDIDPARIRRARDRAQLAYERLGAWRAVAGHYNHYSHVAYSRLANDANFAPPLALIEAIEGTPLPPPLRTLEIRLDTYQRLNAARAGRDWSDFLDGLLGNCEAPR